MKSGTRVVFMTPAESATPAGMPRTPPLRVAELLDRVGGDRGLLARMVELFAVDAAGHFLRARAALAGRDSALLSRCAHALKGAVGNFSAPTVLDLAVELEVAVRAGDWERIAALLATLEMQAALMVAEVRGLARITQTVSGAGAERPAPCDPPVVAGATPPPAGPPDPVRSTTPP